MEKVEDVKPQDLAGIYRRIAEIIGVDNVMLIHERFKGQEIYFPTRLYAKDHIAGQAGSNQSQPVKKQGE